MADYDALNVGLHSPPAGQCGGDDLPNAGRLTVHEFPHVPSLVSGTALEFMRVAGDLALVHFCTSTGSRC